MNKLQISQPNSGYFLKKIPHFYCQKTTSRILWSFWKVSTTFSLPIETEDAGELRSTAGEVPLLNH